jgi:hypothetical protein
LFNAAMVTPTYYVYFTSTTIITSSVLFQGFKGTVSSIVTVVMGFLTICSGVVLLQLSKSAKDVPDAAVFSGNLDQIHTIAEQEQPETEPKADAIRGAAGLIRRISVARQKMEAEEFKRLRKDKIRETLEPVSEDGQTYEWDGLRRRKTIYGSQRSRAITTPVPQSPHPPLGMSHFPTAEELAEADRPTSPAISSIVGTIRNRARSVLIPGHGAHHESTVQSPMHPVQLTEIAVPSQHVDDEPSPFGGYGVPGGKTGYEGSASSSQRHIQFGGDNRQASQGSDVSSTHVGPAPPPHGARRQFSFQNVFRRHQQHGGIGVDGHEEEEDPRQRLQSRHGRPGISSRGYSNPQAKAATEEERLGLVTGDSSHSQSVPALQRYEDEDDDGYGDDKISRYGRGITNSPPRRGSDEKAVLVSSDDEVAEYEQQRRNWNDSGRGRTRTTPPPPPEGQRRHSPPADGNGGAFI